MGRASDYARNKRIISPHKNGTGDDHIPASSFHKRAPRMNLNDERVLRMQLNRQNKKLLRLIAMDLKLMRITQPTKQTKGEA